MLWHDGGDIMRLRMGLWVVAFLWACLPAQAQMLVLRGLPGGDIQIGKSDIEKIGATEIVDAREVTTASGKERIEVVYRGIELPRLLEAKGVDKLDRYALRSATILVVAHDNYRASFSWGELFNTQAGQRTLLIIAERGPATNPKEGAFSLRAFSDLRTGPRHVRDVAEIRVEMAK